MNGGVAVPQVKRVIERKKKHVSSDVNGNDDSEEEKHEWNVWSQGIKLFKICSCITHTSRTRNSFIFDKACLVTTAFRGKQRSRRLSVYGRFERPHAGRHLNVGYVLHCGGDAWWMSAYRPSILWPLAHTIKAGG